MGAGHTHEEPRPAGRTAVRAMLAVILPLALLTLGALVWMWPSGSGVPAGAGPGEVTGGITRHTGTVERIAL